MEELIRKYQTGRLTPDELELLREKLSCVSDEELTELLSLSQEGCDMPFADDEVIDRIKGNIDREIDFGSDSQQTSPRDRVVRIFAGVAAVLLPLLIVSTVWLYVSMKDLSRSDDQLTVVRTGAGERSTVVLPDGTSVTLYNLSTLSFYADRWGDERMVEFSGEAYFSVARQTDSPFVVSAGEMKVKVLGTEFSLMARETSECAELMLDRGKVELTTLKNESCVVLNTGQMATYNKDSGEFAVEQMPPGANVAWRFSGVRYDNVTPDSLVNSLQNIYGVKFGDYVVKSIDSNFTGTLPNDDLTTTFEILSRIYGFPLAFTMCETAEMNRESVRK